MGISVDDVKQTHQLWQKLGGKFTLISDPGARIIRRYGLLHRGGAGTDIALDTSLLVDERGIERWRHVSRTLPDLLSSADTVAQIREKLPPARKSTHP